MSQISIRHPHSVGREAARAAVDEVAGKLAAQYGVEHAWRGDVLTFSRRGVDGRIELNDQEIRVDVRLGLMTAPFGAVIERGIREQLAKRLG